MVWLKENWYAKVRKGNSQKPTVGSDKPFSRFLAELTEGKGSNWDLFSNSVFIPKE